MAGEMIARGSLCMVVRTVHRRFMGKYCTCVANGLKEPFGSHVFEFPDGIQASGEPHNVIVISPPPLPVSTKHSDRETA